LTLVFRTPDLQVVLLGELPLDVCISVGLGSTNSPWQSVLE